MDDDIMIYIQIYYVSDLSLDKNILYPAIFCYHLLIINTVLPSPLPPQV